MRVLLYLLPRLGTPLQGLLLWRLLKQRSNARYPYLTLFVGYNLLRDLMLFPVAWYRPDWFAPVYWRTEVVSLFFRFLVDWEFVRGVFPRSSTLYDLSWRALIAVECGVLPAILWLTWTQASASRHVYFYMSPIFEQYLSLVQVLVLLVPAGVAWYYRYPLGRNMKGLGLGFGIYLSVCAVNFASLQAFKGFGPYWRLLSPTSFFCMIGLWLWAFWRYIPLPNP